MRNHLLDPIVEIHEAAIYLDAAVSAHLDGDRFRAEKLIRLADKPAIAQWSDALWGKGGPWTRPIKVDNAFPFVVRDERHKARMPSRGELSFLLKRDGHRCRFCSIPLIRAEVRNRIRDCYPDALRWGNRNGDQHSAFQAMWLQYDHIIPYARGGSNDPGNMLVTCAPCNNGRSNLTLDEVGLDDPRERTPLKTTWDGLERFV